MTKTQQVSDDQSPLLATEIFRAPQPANDVTQNFQLILMSYRNGLLQIPPHQRDPDAWDPNKRNQYIARLRDAAKGCHPPGMFVTYELVKAGKAISPVFLNDGFQRLKTLDDLASDPIRFGMDTEGVQALLLQQISVQHRWYPSHYEAMGDFQKINNGTRLTPHELCRGLLRYMPDYEAKWRPLLDHIQKTVEASEARVRNNTALSRVMAHKLRRHTLALFLRFLTNERRLYKYVDVAAAEVQRYVDKGQVVEIRLSNALQEKGHPEASNTMKAFRSFINNETAELEDSLHKILGGGTGLAPVTHRWLLDLAVWRRNNQIPRERYGQFVVKLLKATQGGGLWLHDLPPGGKPVTLGLSHLGLLPKLAELADMADFCDPPRRRRRRPARPGYDNSHYEPVITHGDGPTFPEPAPTNRSRGAQTVEGMTP